MQAHSQMLEFRIGDRVSFRPEGRPVLVGMLTRYNKKSVTVITDTGEHWNIAPTFLRKAEEPGGSVRPDQKNVIRLPPK